MTPAVRKLALTAHVTASVGWVGALAVFFAHALASVASQDAHIVRAAAIAMGIAAWFVILPLSVTAIGTGVFQALAGAWGLFRHYWIVFKLALTAVATFVLLLKLQPISHLAQVAAEATFTAADLTGLRASLLLHAAGGLVVLLAIVALAVYKPAGTTRDASMPRWAKLSAILLAALIALIVIMVLAGGHGPGMHAG